MGIKAAATRPQEERESAVLDVGVPLKEQLGDSHVPVGGCSM